ncbi:hypothetical protein [Sphingomonas turrisvirgatae]|uniref:Uncharacterized protein n=1 Tax=Sphingomonas turrisvirgatae TaxID=1888892 RepID=A0A1E3M2S1_9SPHN|nr:hypothetical protein [Sphingomonas turrisvirgatae]ODP39360.1 hypothetical protein BFL28_11165 [Sphingomonas turrisvirgatae]
MGKWWRENAELRRKAAVIAGLLWAFGAVPIAVVLFRLGEEWAWIALALAVAPFILAAAVVATFIAAAPVLARNAMTRAIALAVAAAVGGLVIGQPMLTAVYAAAVVVAWLAIELWQGRQPARR